MPFDLSQVGKKSKTYPHRYDWRKLATYALGIGAKKAELPYLYEGAAGGIRALPTYAVVPAFEPVMELLAAAQTNFAMVVHGAQKIRALRPIPPEGTIETVGTLRGIYDLKKLASLIVETESRLVSAGKGGEPVFTTEWNILVRGEGGFGGERPPKDEDAATAPKDREPDWTVEEATSPEQALLYRISGDVNPLHADPELAARVGFPRGPILHGLCTFGFCARAAIAKAGGGDATKLIAMGAQFRNPVWPGDTLVTQGYDLGGGKVALQVFSKGKPAEPSGAEPSGSIPDPVQVITNGWATFQG